MEGRDLIVAARRGAGLTQLQLAERLGRCQPTISAWENGTQRPSLETIVEVVRACGQNLAVGLPKADDSYNALIRAQLRLTPPLASLPWTPSPSSTSPTRSPRSPTPAPSSW